jgi:hypothetical protein
MSFVGVDGLLGADACVNAVLVLALSALEMDISTSFFPEKNE